MRFIGVNDYGKHSYAKLGFSFYEMLIVLLIVSILLTIAYPTYQSLMKRTDAELMRHEILQLIHLAQMTAVTKHLSVIICKSHDGEHCNRNEDANENKNINVQDGAIVMTLADGDYQNSNVIYVAAKGRGQLEWRSYPRYRDAVLFSPNGTLASDNSTFWYCQKENAHPLFAIFLSHSGRTRVVTPDQNHLIYDAKKKEIQCA